MKKIISLAIVCVMMLGMLSMVSFAAPAAIGESTTTWEITGTKLTISGTGAMPTMAKADYPWNGSRETITEVVVTDGVTEVSKEAFASCTALTKVTFGADVKVLWNDCIAYNSALTTVVFNSKIETLKQGTVYGSGSISSVTLGGGQTWEEFEALIKGEGVAPYNDNFLKCKEYAVYAVKKLGTLDATATPWSLENWGKNDDHPTFHGTFFVVHYDFTKGETNYGAEVLAAIKNGLAKVTVTVVDETAEKRYTIDDYKFDYDDDCKFEGCTNDANGHHFYTALPDYNLYRFEVTDYGVELVAGNTYTLSVKITCDGSTVVDVTSETGAFTCPEDPQIIDQPSYTCQVTDLSEPAPGPVEPPKNGDATVFAVAFAVVAMFGMAVVVTKKVHA